MKILVLNAGSSSQKSCLYDLDYDNNLPSLPPPPLWEGKVDWSHHQGVAEIEVETARGDKFTEEIATDSQSEVMSRLLDTICEGSTKVINKLADIDVVGHRVVHGGRKYRESTVINQSVKDAIAHLAKLAPAHNPANLAGIEAVENILGDIKQVAVFDTAFHSNIPDKAAIYPGPFEWTQQDIIRYGFHGIGHQYCSQRAADILGKDLMSLRLISCHLGNGCSLAAIKNARSVDTTMGFTPLEGLMMGSRSGSVDPGILIYLLQQDNYTVEQLDNILNKASGLKGISGISSDMRQIKAAISQGNYRAQLAFDIYVHRLRSNIGSMLGSLAGLDALIFTAGIGENSPEIRQAACEAFEFLGIKIDTDKNIHKPIDEDISTSDSAVKVLVIHTQENWQIARECYELIAHQV
ncbi:MAG: acetate kinase [Rivularia sp. (in: Bacteria)]|nr:acetate kinase [Rivularia sp. MS3]